MSLSGSKNFYIKNKVSWDKWRHCLLLKSSIYGMEKMCNFAILKLFIYYFCKRQGCGFEFFGRNFEKLTSRIKIPLKNELYRLTLYELIDQSKNKVHISQLYWHLYWEKSYERILYRSGLFFEGFGSSLSWRSDPVFSMGSY